MPSEINVPFRVDASGAVVTTSDPDAQVRLHVLALLNTTPDERMMVPGYGTNTLGLVFEDMDSSEISGQVSTLLNTAFNTWEPGVKVTTVIPNRKDDGQVDAVEVEFSRKDAADSGTVANANVAIIGAGGTVREIVRG